MGFEFRIISPCDKNRESLHGSGPVLWCADCKKPVHDFTNMSDAGIKSVAGASGLCGIVSPKPMPARRLFFLWLAAWRWAAVAAEPKGLSGSVVDESAAAIPRASVRVLSPGSDTIRKGKTDDLGRFSFTDLPLGDYQLKIEAAGFQLKTVSANLSGSTLDLGPIMLRIGLMGEVVLVESKVPVFKTLFKRRRVER
jgi:Carboxypeptidase regulatory-like domain